MNTIDQEATDRVLAARIKLIKSRCFYGVLVTNVEPVLSRQFPTMATDGRRHYFNPEFVMGLTYEELLGVQAHESEHDARHHGTRRGNRDPHEWNICCDLAINGDLLKEGFTLPKDRLHDPKYDGMGAEDIYRARELDRQKEQQKPQPEDGDGEADDDADDEQSDDSDDDKDSDDGEQSADDKSEDEGDDDGDSDAEGNDTGDGEADDSDDDATGKGDAEDGDDAEGKGAGSGEGDDSDDDAQDTEGNGSGDADDKGTSKQPTSSGDAGGCGEVLDAADDAGAPADTAEQDIKWEKIVRQAASMAKARGELPGHITREIERANNPPRNWRDELREFCEQGALRIETWNRPNRRFSHSGLVLPSTQKDGVSKAAFLIDTSGSMDDVALACVRDEAQALLDDGIIDEIVVVYGDTRVTRVDEYSTGDEIEFDPRGGGGTDMKPLFKYVADELPDATLIINFTDLYIGDAGPEPTVPVLFAVYGYPGTVQSLIERAPWGAKGIDVGAH
jgi:predicted metal-dependent peptidase